MSVDIDVVIHHDSETESYWAVSPQLPGCHAAGKTLEDLYESLQEAVQLYLEDGEHPDLLLSGTLHSNLSEYPWLTVSGSARG